MTALSVGPGPSVRPSYTALQETCSPQIFPFAFSSVFSSVSFGHLGRICSSLTPIINYRSHVEASLFLDKPLDARESIARVVSDSWTFLFLEVKMSDLVLVCGSS